MFAFLCSLRSDNSRGIQHKKRDVIRHVPNNLINQELKQRLSRTSVCTSDVDIDRIVKESKTTTITETRETIHFRPRESTDKEDVCSSSVEIPVRKRLSILDSTFDERRARQTSPNTSTYRKSSATRSGAKTPPSVMIRTKPSASRDDNDDLAADYANLEKELQDINERNKELKKRFFEEKTETPIMGRSSPLPSMSSRIQEWDSMSIRARERRKCTFAGPKQEVMPEVGKLIELLESELVVTAKSRKPSKEQHKTSSSSTGKQNGSSHNIVK
ncbi:unnamed protein product [Cylicocyclus nassatus]|uniref:Uncharacterized protein n=1 Tax=Cylicocyclus nassatus TaxID=53992 RepID=A0AA36DPT8_CYLNA|nr:unnamed protein product [Cylicocyclus nassatus]